MDSGVEQGTHFSSQLSCDQNILVFSKQPTCCRVSSPSQTVRMKLPSSAWQEVQPGSSRVHKRAELGSSRWREPYLMGRAFVAGEGSRGPCGLRPVMISPGSTPSRGISTPTSQNTTLSLTSLYHRTRQARADLHLAL